MDFFEELRERAISHTVIKMRHEHRGESGMAIDATIEALKEMMVGEPMSRRIVHYEGKSWFVPGLSCISSIEIGTDGEEVYVIVVRKEQETCP